MRTVNILPESATPDQFFALVPPGTHAFVFARTPRGELGIRLVSPGPGGPQLSAPYETGPESRLRSFARSVATRHPTEKGAFEA